MTTLTIKDRYELIKNTHRLPSTLRLRMSVDAFFNLIEITQEEREKYSVKIDPSTYELSCNDNDYVVDYKEFPKEVISAIRDFVTGYDGKDDYKENVLIQNTISNFKKVL